jgi:hypothetical protein
MKKNLALILALVMLVGSLFSLAPMAEEAGTTPPAAETPAVRYTPEIAYSNLNYSDKMYMMFAVPAPASLDEGASVKLIVWNSRYDSISFSYNDIVKTVIEAEPATVKIGEVDHIVFKYDALAANNMSKVICARPAVVKNDVATAYGKLVEYSVLEYVAAARGEFEGIEALKDQAVLDLLDSMLDFGALAEKFLSDEEPEFYANDELNKIYVNPVVNGIAKDKVFAGFFKYDLGDIITFTAPFIDGTEVVAVKDADGNVIEDADENTDGLQFSPADADLNLTVEYKNISIRSLNADALGPDVSAANYGEVTGGYPGMVKRNGSNGGVKLGPDVTCNLSGWASQLDSYGRMNYWHGFRTVTDPEDPNGLVLMASGTHSPALNFTNTKPADWAGYGFGDTVYPAFTFEITLGAVNGRMPTTGSYYFRHRQEVPGVDEAKYTNVYIFSIKNGEFLLADGKTVVGKIPETGMAKFAVTVDALTNEVYGYCEDENGVMRHTATTPLNLDKNWVTRHEAHLKNLADEDPTNDTYLASYESIFAYFTKSSLEPTWNFTIQTAKVLPEFENAEIEVNGVMTKIKNEDGTFNMEAVQALAERDYSYLFDDFNLTLGAIYK